MKDIKELLTEATSKKTIFSIDDFFQATEYLKDYYKEFPEEKGQYPNWGELDNYFDNPKLTDALCYNWDKYENDPVIQLINKYTEIFYINK